MLGKPVRFSMDKRIFGITQRQSRSKLLETFDHRVRVKLFTLNYLILNLNPEQYYLKHKFQLRDLAIQVVTTNLKSIPNLARSRKCNLWKILHDQRHFLSSPSYYGQYPCIIPVQPYNPCMYYLLIVPVLLLLLLLLYCITISLSQRSHQVS